MATRTLAGGISATLTDNAIPKSGGAGGASDLQDSGLRYEEVALTSANILAMNGTPVTLLAAVTGKAIVVERLVVKLVRTATAYANGGAVEFRYTNASGDKVSADLAAAVITAAGAGTSYTTLGGIEASLTAVVSAPIVITNATAAFITGTGAATIGIFYMVL